MANEPSACERELLEMLAEEASEVVQAVTKILRHGWDSYDPTVPVHRRVSNRDHLRKECVEVSAIYEQLVRNGSVNNFNAASLYLAWKKKLRYTHHQQEAEEPKQPSDHVNDLLEKCAESGPVNIIREQFEKWALKQGMDISCSRNTFTSYSDSSTEQRWRGWCAAEQRKFDWPPQEEAPAAASEPEPENHWFAVTHSHVSNKGTINCTTFVGYPGPTFFTREVLNNLKKDAGIPLESVLMSITPLGIGTRSEFTGEGK